MLITSLQKEGFFVNVGHHDEASVTVWVWQTLENNIWELHLPDRPEWLHLKSYALSVMERPQWSAVAVRLGKEMGLLVLARSFCCVGGCDQQGNSLHLSGSVSQRTGQPWLQMVSKLAKDGWSVLITAVKMGSTSPAGSCQHSNQGQRNLVLADSVKPLQTLAQKLRPDAISGRPHSGQGYERQVMR